MSPKTLTNPILLFPVSMRESTLVAGTIGSSITLRLYIDHDGVPVLRTEDYGCPKRFPRVLAYGSRHWSKDKAKYWWQSNDAVLNVDVLPNGEEDVLDYLKHLRKIRESDPIRRVPTHITGKRIHDTVYKLYLYMQLDLSGDTATNVYVTRSNGDVYTRRGGLDHLIPTHWKELITWATKYAGHSLKLMAHHNESAVVELESLIAKVKEHRGKVIWGRATNKVV